MTDAQKAMAEAILEMKNVFGSAADAKKPQIQLKGPSPPVGVFKKHVNAMKQKSPAAGRKQPVVAAAAAAAAAATPPAPLVADNGVKLRDSTALDVPSSPGAGAAASAGYRNLSLYTNEQALEAMRKLCNSAKIESVYKFGKRLGAGSGGTVYQATHLKESPGKKVAVKNIDLTTGEKKVHLLMEVMVMRELVHPNLVTFSDIFLTQKELWVVMEYMDAGALTEVVTFTILGEGQMATVCREVLSGLQYLHDHEVVHRDIKSDNVLLSMKGAVKITGEFNNLFFAPLSLNAHSLRFRLRGQRCR